MDIETTIKNILVNDLFINLDTSSIGLDDGFRDVLGVDSLGFSELRAQCQYVFDIKINDADFTPQYFSSIRTLKALIEKLLLEKQAS